MDIFNKQIRFHVYQINSAGFFNNQILIYFHKFCAAKIGSINPYTFYYFNYFLHAETWGHFVLQTAVLNL